MYFKTEIQHRKLGAYDSTGRAGQKKVKEPRTRFGFSSSFEELRSGRLLPLIPFTPSLRSGDDSRELANVVTSAMQH